MLNSCAAMRGAGPMAAAEAGFNSDFRQALDRTLWEPEPLADADGLCGTDPARLETTPDGLRLSLDNQNWKNNSCAYGSLWSKRPLGYGTVSAVLKLPIHPGETAEFLLVGDARSKDGPQKAIELRFLGKDMDAVQARALWDARAGERDAGMSRTIPLGFKPGADFHAWSIAWTPGRITWSADGLTLCSTTLAVPDVPLTLVLRHSVPDSDDPNASGDWNASRGENLIRYGSLDRSAWPSFTYVRSLKFVPLH
jgi:hypothetical protein